MDKFKLYQIKRQQKLNEIVKEIIQEDVKKIKQENNLKQEGEIPNRDGILRKYENVMPFVLFCLVESIFVDTRNSKKVKEISCGLLIDINIVLVFARSLMPIEDRNLSKDEGESDLQGKNFKLEEVTFTPMNLSEKYKHFLPNKIKLKDYYAPFSKEELDIKDNLTDEEKIMNSWGLALIDFPLGEFIGYVLEEENLIQVKKTKSHEGKYIPNPFIEVKSIDNDDLFNSEIFFLEANSECSKYPKIRDAYKDITVPNSYTFAEHFYDIKFDDNLIFLRSLSNQNRDDDNNNCKPEEIFLPGMILSHVNRRFYLVGMNTDIVIKINEESDHVEDDHDIVEATPKKVNEISHRLGVRFSNEALNSIFEKIQEIKSSYTHAFSSKLFRLILKELSTKEIFLNYLRDNCQKLLEFIKSLQNDKNLKLTRDEKEMLCFNEIIPSSSDKAGNKNLINGTNNFIKFSLSLIWNKITNSENELNNKGKLMNFDSLNFGLHPATEIIGEILRNTENLKLLNLNSNQIFSNGVKNLIKPIFNPKLLNIVGKNLVHLHLDNNKLSSKSLKYLRHLLKFTASLKSFTLNHNYIDSDGLKHLINAMKFTNELTNFGLGFNMLGRKSGNYLHEILKHLGKLQELDLQSNNLTDHPIRIILSALKINKSLKSIYLSNNSLTKQSAESIAEYLNNNSTLLKLWLNNNPLSIEGINAIGKSLSGKMTNSKGKAIYTGDHSKNNSSDRKEFNFPALKEINLTNVNPSSQEEGGNFFNLIKYNFNIEKIIFNSNNIGDLGCMYIKEYFSNQAKGEDLNTMYKFDKNVNVNKEFNPGKGLIYLSISDNNITDEGVKILVESILNHKTLKEIKLNSNKISDEGAELLLYSVLYNNSIVKLNLENNETSWRDKNLDIKNLRSNVEIFF